MDKYIFGIIVRTESGMNFQKYGSGTLGKVALWMNTVFPIYRDHGEFFSMPEDAFNHVQALQKREGVD